MKELPASLSFVAKKICRVPGVAGSFIAGDGGINVVLTTEDSALRESVQEICMRAMMPVRVFYQLEDGSIIDSSDNVISESLDSFYKPIHVAGFLGSSPSADAAMLGGDAYGGEVGAEPPDRSDSGQLKLVRLRAKTRGREVVGWQYGKHTLKAGHKVRFKTSSVLQWTGGKTVTVAPGTMGKVSQVSSKSPMVYVSIGGRHGLELPVHAAGHVFDVMADPALESIQIETKDKKQDDNRKTEPKHQPSPEFKSLMMALGFGRPPREPWETPTNGPNPVSAKKVSPSWDADDTEADMDEAADDVAVVEPKEKLLVRVGKTVKKLEKLDDRKR